MQTIEVTLYYLHNVRIIRQYMGTVFGQCLNNCSWSTLSRHPRLIGQNVTKQSSRGLLVLGVVTSTFFGGDDFGDGTPDEQTSLEMVIK